MFHHSHWHYWSQNFLWNFPWILLVFQDFQMSWKCWKLPNLWKKDFHLCYHHCLNQPIEQPQMMKKRCSCHQNLNQQCWKIRRWLIENTCWKQNMLKDCSGVKFVIYNQRWGKSDALVITTWISSAEIKIITIDFMKEKLEVNWIIGKLIQHK